MQLRQIELFRANKGVPVQIDAEPGSGVVARLVRTGPREGVCIIVDSRQNRGVAARDCYERFAWAACERFGISFEGIEWFLLDAEGHFDEARFAGETVAIVPLAEAPFLRRGREAMLARLARLGITSRDAVVHLLGNTLPSPGQAYRNNKNGRLYRVTGSLINATNAQDGQLMVKYVPEANPEQEFARELGEFHEKFSVAASSPGAP